MSDLHPGNPELPIERRLPVAFSLHRLGVQMMRENLRRRNPDADDDAIDGMLADWMRNRPLDAPGRPSRRFGD